MERCLLILTVAIFNSNLYAQDSNSLKQKVLLLTNSTFHASRGEIKPFNPYCQSTEPNFELFGSYRFFESSKDHSHSGEWLRFLSLNVSFNLEQ